MRGLNKPASCKRAIPDAGSGRQRAPSALRLAAGFAILLTTGACSSLNGLFATVGPDYAKPALNMPGNWNAGTPAKPVEKNPTLILNEFWASFDDPILPKLIEAVQKASPDIIAAQVRIDEAQAAVAGAAALQLPDLNATASAVRSKVVFFGPPTIRQQSDIGLKSSWELDLFGGIARQNQAAIARLQGSEMQWHDARISIAASTAQAYFGYRQCEAQQTLLEDELASRQRSATSLEAAVQAGLKSASSVIPEQAALADMQRVVRQKTSNCAAQIKALVALSQISETEVRAILDSQPQLKGRLPEPPAFEVSAIPADLLMQRPDLRALERNLAAAAADIGAATAQLYPSLTLTGSVAPTRSRFGEQPTTTATTWSIGPSFNLPLFNRDRISANVKATQSRYAGFEAQFRSKAFGAVREVEESMLKVDSTAEELASARKAAELYQVQLQQEQARFDAGLISSTELEINRRFLLRSRLAMTDVQLDRLNASITLYRALGGQFAGEQKPQANNNPTRRIARSPAIKNSKPLDIAQVKP